MVVEHHRAVVLGEDVGSEGRGVRVDRERAQVLDDDEVGAGERRAQGAGIGGAPFDRIDGEEGKPGVVGPEAVVELPGDAADAEAELVECPFPLPRLDGDAVGTAESIRHHHRDRLHWTRRLARVGDLARVSEPRLIPCGKFGG